MYIYDVWEVVMGIINKHGIKNFDVLKPPEHSLSIKMEKIKYPKKYK